MVCAPVRPVAVQPASAPVDAADDDGAVDGRRWIAGGEIRLVEGTLIACANYPGCASHSDFAGHASYGYCPSKSQFVWGMRPDVICDIKGVPVGYDLVGPKTGSERDCALELAAGHPGTWIADKGFWGREYDACLQLVGVGLITLDKQRPGRRSRSELAKAASGSCESVFSTLKRQTRLEIHLAKTLPGVVARIAQRLLALTLGIYLNTLSAAQHAPSPPTTDDEPTSSLSHSHRRPTGCDPSGAIAGHVPVVLRPLSSADLKLVDAGDRVARRSACVCDVRLRAGPWSASPAQPVRTQPISDGDPAPSSASPSGPRRGRAKRGT